MSSFSENLRSWGPTARKFALGIGLAVFLVCGYRALTRPYDGDFKLHWEFGRRLLAGEELYAGGLHIPYLPFWAFVHAPLTFLPMPVAKALQLLVGMAALGLLLWILRSLSREASLLQKPASFWVAVAALVFTSRYLVRDFAEVGVNTTLVALTWVSIWLWQRRRNAWAGIILGLAIALKCTPALFLAYFAWKRQWRLAAWALSAAVLFTLLPVTVMGPERFARHIEQWSKNLLRGVAGGDPTAGVLGPEPLQNMSLRPSLGRYLVQLPPDHPGRARHPFYFDFLSLPRSTAAWIVLFFVATLVGVFFWWARRPVEPRGEATMLWQCAALSILMLLMSPITWGQHCVALLPAFFFIAALVTRGRALPPWMLLLLAFYAVVVLFLNRDFVGRDLAYLLASYHLETFAFLGLFAVVVGCGEICKRRS